MKPCNLCPRRCDVDREDGQPGICGVDSHIYVARAALHHWEEPCISGTNGSGAVFFGGCGLRCVYCQNYDIATTQVGKEISRQRLTEIFLELQNREAANLNLVTPSHYVLEIIAAMEEARKQGLRIPVVYNTSGYERVETLKMLDGIVDIYLTDFKYMNEETAARYSRAGDYPGAVKAALEEMVRQVGQPIFDRKGMMQRGVIVRHLLLPGHVHEAEQMVKYVHETYGNQVYLSLMNQFTPFERLYDHYPEIARKVTKREYETLIDYALDLGVEQAFIQEGDTAEESFIPSFDYEGV
ncbi:MAG TPA: radical SAM protein [Candidatus Pelethocola excrementipullorum]|nr:radical SAM protein [Candidatus Pelethocola excrementipullorum]